MSGIRYDGVNPSKLPGPCGGKHPIGTVRVIGVKGALDAEGFTGWVEVVPSVYNTEGGEGEGTAVKVDPGVIVLTSPAFLRYGGGRTGGQVYVERMPPRDNHVHYLTQHITAAPVGPAPNPITVPAGAVRVKLPIGDNYRFLDGPTGAVLDDMIINAGDTPSVVGVGSIDCRSASVPYQIAWIVEW